MSIPYYQFQPLSPAGYSGKVHSILKAAKLVKLGYFLDDIFIPDLWLARQLIVGLSDSDNFSVPWIRGNG